MGRMPAPRARNADALTPAGRPCHARRMFADAAAFLRALEAQVVAQENDDPPPGQPNQLRLQIAFPDRASMEKFVRYGQIAVAEFGRACLVTYLGWPIPHLYYDPVPQDYEAAYRRHVLGRMLPERAHDAVLQGRNVDHVFPRTTALRNRIGYVLLLPCDAAANKSAGGGVERRQSFDWNRSPRPYGADWSTLAKFGGLPAPSIARGTDLSAEAARLTRLLAGRFPTVMDTPQTRIMVETFLKWTRDKV